MHQPCSQCPGKSRGERGQSTRNGMIYTSPGEAPTCPEPSLCSRLPLLQSLTPGLVKQVITSDCMGLKVMVAARPKLCSLGGHSACAIPWAGRHSPRTEVTCLSQSQHLHPSCLCPYFPSALLLALFSIHLFFYYLLLPIKLL